jgi:hypothetical protein
MATAWFLSAPSEPPDRVVFSRMFFHGDADKQVTRTIQEAAAIRAHKLA